MLKHLIAACALAALSAAPAQAEVLTSAPGGFIVRHVVSVRTDNETAWRRFVEVRGWWSSEHTFSHDAKNLKIDARPGGCWCEKLPGGGFVRHMEVVYAAPGAMLRLSGGLGPLQEMAVNGAMTVKFEADGPSTTVTMTYAVGGYAPTGLAPIAPLVDGVLGEQMLRYREYVGRGR